MAKEKYKILFVLTPALHPNEGGVQMSTWKVGSWLAEQGHQVGVFSFEPEGHVDPQLMRLFHPAPSGRSDRQSGLKLLSEVLDSFKPDVVINQMPYEHDIGGVLIQNKPYLLLGCLRNTLFSVRGNLGAFVARTAPGPLKRFSNVGLVQQAFLAIHRRRHRSDLQRILATHDYFVMFGPPNLEELRYFVPDFDEERVRLVPNSIPEVDAAPVEKEKRFLYLGRLAHEQKRSELILPIWQQVSKALPDWELDVVGDGPLRETLQRESERLSLPRIHFHGRQVPDEYYRRAAIFFMTSAFEGFPNTLIEAQSRAAIPVVFDSYPVASWIVEDGVNGFLVPPFDVERMASRLISIVKDENRMQIAEGALRNARRFHIDSVGEMWEKLFDAEAPTRIQQHAADAS